MNELVKWLGVGKLNYAETIRHGFDSIPQTFIDFFGGNNKGKMMIEI